MQPIITVNDGNIQQVVNNSSSPAKRNRDSNCTTTSSSQNLDLNQFNRYSPSISNKRNKNDKCNHCFLSSHSRITSILCLRNNKNSQFVPYDIEISNPELTDSTPSLSNPLEYTINTQIEIPISQTVS